MPADAPPKLPPVRAARAVDSLRRRLRRFERKLQPPNASLLKLISTAWIAQDVYTATKLGIIEALHDGPKSADVIAESVGADPDAVYRLMRLLARRGIFTQRRGGRFALAPMGEALRIDAPDSIRGYVLFAGDPLHWEHWGQLSHSVHTGRCAIEEDRGKPTFEWFQDVPGLAAAFNDGMTSISKMETPVVVSAYDFSQFGTIVDVGGGHGLLVSAILRRAPNSRGILFDAESVPEGAQAVLGSAGVSDRCAAIGGSFFESVPAGADAYVLKHIIHDWDDEKSLQIMRNVRTAMNPDAKVLIVEAVVPENDREHLSKLLDLEMLVRQRQGAHGGGVRRVVAPGGFPLHPYRSHSRARLDCRSRSGRAAAVRRRYAVGRDDPRRIRCEIYRRPFLAGERRTAFLAGLRFAVFLAAARLVAFLAGARFAVFLAAVRFVAVAFLAGVRFVAFLAAVRLVAAFLAGLRFTAFLAAVFLAALRAVPVPLPRFTAGPSADRRCAPETTALN
jgi:hypothetical protein